jgi:hypothetical protein
MAHCKNSRSLVTNLISFACVLVLVCVPVYALTPIHPFHVTVAEMEYKPDEKKIEAAMRLWPVDLEAAVRKHSKREDVRLEETKDVDDLILAYLKDHLKIKSSDGGESKLLWVGKEQTPKHVWVYFEIELAGELDRSEMEHRVLLADVEEQTNFVTLHVEKKRFSWQFNSEKPSLQIDLSAPIAADQESEPEDGQSKKADDSSKSAPRDSIN